MTDNKEQFIPELTLDPINDVFEIKEETVTDSDENSENLKREPLSVEEQKIVDQFAEKIDLHNSQLILQYGAGAQTKLASFSENTLNNVRTKDLGEVGNLITDLVGELKNFDSGEDQKGFFKKKVNKLKTLKVRYDTAEVNIDKITKMLDEHKITLLKDIALLDEMYKLNIQNYKELTMYIAAGKQRLEKARNVELVALIEKARQTELSEDTQLANDFASLCDRFEKKIYDLELTRTVALQMGPQIRLVQNNNILMTEKIQSSLVNTIPLWKSQMVLALGLANSTSAMEAQRAVTNMTNDLLKKNADTLKMGSIETAKEAERGLVDIETLKHTNESLISTLDEVLKIQEEGRAKRSQAEHELIKIESDLKKKLLDIRG
jgi:Uncharacterized protein involved in tellurite resistance